MLHPFSVSLSATVSTVMETIVSPLVNTLDEHVEGLLKDLESLAAQVTASSDQVKRKARELATARQATAATSS